MDITRKTKISDALKASHAVAKLLSDKNLPCARCKGSHEDTIEKVAYNHGMRPDELLAEIKSVCGK